MATKRILLLDDDPFALQVLALQLQRLGEPEVEAVTRGSVALERLRGPDTTADLFFLDLNMPDMDGVECVRHLVAQEYRGALVLVSGEENRILEAAERLARAHGLHVLGRLSKPVPLHALQATLDAWRTRVRRGDEVARLPYRAEDLRRALENEELLNYFQPQVDLGSGAVAGFEALVRWQHPDDGIVPPSQFLPVAEADGLLPELTRVVLRTSLRELRRWHQSGFDHLRLSVNVGASSLRDVQFADFVLETLQETGIAPMALTLEVTESQAVESLVSPLDILTRLRLKRIGLAIDDFGTGHSSLAQLRDLPFDEVKLDRGFVHGARRDQTRRAILSASVGMAGQLGMKTVAEGVEDATDWSFVQHLRCTVAQGNFFAGAMPGAEVPAWLAAWDHRRAGLIAPLPEPPVA